MMTTKTLQKTETETLFADLDKPSLHALSYALRHPDTWPEGFVWDYSHCGQCAMGLAHKLWDISIKNQNGKDGLDGARPLVSSMAKHFAMAYLAAEQMFFYTPSRKPLFGFIPAGTISYAAVMPEMIADQIDEYLETVE